MWYLTQFSTFFHQTSQRWKEEAKLKRGDDDLKLDWVKVKILSPTILQQLTIPNSTT
jgi:hypothetical protein